MRIWGQAVGGRGQAEPPAAPSGRIAKAEVRLEQAQKVEIRRWTRLCSADADASKSLKGQTSRAAGQAGLQGG